MTALRSSKDSIPYMLAVPSALLLKIPAQMPVSGRSSDDLFWDEDMSLLLSWKLDEIHLTCFAELISAGCTTTSFSHYEP